MNGRPPQATALSLALLVSAACAGARPAPPAAPGPSRAPFIAIKVDTVAWGEANMHPMLQRPNDALQPTGVGEHAG
jgi:hypothetical protein